MKNVINRAIMAKKKMIFTLMLAIVSSVWMTNEASNWCMPSVRTLTNPWIEVNGTFQAEGFPCEPDEECPPCLTIVLVTSNKTYYLVTDDGQLIEQLDTIPLGTKATVSGVPFTHGSYNYIQVSQIKTDQKLPSLCDEWNIAKISNAFGPQDVIHTVKAFLGSNTIIESQNYVKLIEDSKYKGAMREGVSGVIYYIPAGSAHEYLLYNFNAQVGDRLTNLWYGGDPERCPNGYNATVLSISDETPRVFTVEVEYIITDSDGEHIIPWTIYWTEGVGLSDGPAGQFCPGPDCECSCGQVLLCAYKNGEQVYVSEMGEQYGCEYNYNPNTNHTDTIPLYAQDDSGSSTVDPVDPNQIYATLMGNVLTVHNNTGAQVTFTLNNTSVNNVAARVRANAEPVSFTESISVELSEDGIYEILLTSEEWNYTVFGTVNYIRSGTDVIKEDPASTTKKVLRGTQILIEREGKTYTLTGQEVK